MSSVPARRPASFLSCLSGLRGGEGEARLNAGQTFNQEGSELQRRMSPKIIKVKRAWQYTGQLAGLIRWHGAGIGAGLQRGNHGSWRRGSGLTEEADDEEEVSPRAAR